MYVKGEQRLYPGHNHIRKHKTRHLPAVINPLVIGGLREFVPESKVIVANIHLGNSLGEFAFFEQPSGYVYREIACI